MNYIKIFVVFLLFSFGCSSYTVKEADDIDYNKEYEKVWNSTKKVLLKHNLRINLSQYREGTMVATSRVQSDFLDKSRVKVVARIVENEEGYFEPGIRVLTQLDISDVKAWRNSDYEVNQQWINISNNTSMETRLYNEIMDDLHGKNTYSGKFWKSVDQPESENMYEERNSETTQFTPEVW